MKVNPQSDEFILLSKRLKGDKLLVLFHGIEGLKEFGVDEVPKDVLLEGSGSFYQPSTSKIRRLTSGSRLLILTVCSRLSARESEVAMPGSI